MLGFLNGILFRTRIEPKIPEDKGANILPDKATPQIP
jgi:hypothetical protein